MGFVKIFFGGVIARTQLMSNAQCDIIPPNMKVVKDLCDRAVWLYNGEIKRDGDTEKVVQEYIETTDWNECQILMTDDLSSTSGKMKKAQKKGIEIKQYY